MKAILFSRFTTLRGKLTAGQRATIRVSYDSVEPEALASDEAESAGLIWGPVDRIPKAARRVFVQAKGRDVAGTKLGAERCGHLGLTLPLSRIGRDELAYVIFIGPKMRHARVGLRFALAALKSHAVRIEDESRDGFTIVRGDGRRVRFECFAAARGGDTVRGVPVVAALLDEAAFHLDEATGVVNAEANFAAIIPRLLPGGQILIVSSVWAESGLLYSEFTKNWGHPLTAMAAHCPTLVMRDDPETIAMVAAERERDPENAKREFDAEFLGGGAGLFFPNVAITASMFPDLYPLSEAPAGSIVGVGADIALVKDSSAIGAVYAEEGGFRIGEMLELRPARGAPLKLSEVIRTFCAFTRRHGARTFTADHHAIEPAREHLIDGVSIVPAPGGQDGKESTYVEAKKALVEGRLRIPGEYKRFAEQARAVVATARSGGGVAISSPRRGGAHGDLVSAFVLALLAAQQASQPHDMRVAGCRRGFTERIRARSGWT
ncbi:MAG TPA: hypothetical protein VHU80_02885 [Polyangiaceae bacterium]|nr:hypothetical protein [Polyangiaceae bacterium]